MVEQLPVKELVPGSSPGRGADDSCGTDPSPSKRPGMVSCWLHWAASAIFHVYTMKRYSKPFPVSNIARREPTIDPRPEYQRGPVWSTKQKQLLIDTILRDLDIPKLYFRSVHGGNYEFEIVDGQQRLNAIWGFRKNKFKLLKDSDPIDGRDVANITYQDLPQDLQDKFDMYPLDVVILEGASLDEVEEMFVRLQNGTSLKAAEKRNALPGNMKYFVRDLAQHDFFKLCGFDSKRYDYDQVAAQCTALELNGGPCNIRNVELEKMYIEGENFDKESAEAKKIYKVFNFLKTVFQEKTPELKKFNVISLYLLSSILLEKYARFENPQKLAKWFIDFETKRLQETEKPEDERDSEMVAYQNYTSHSTDAQESLEYRNKILSRDFFMVFPDLQPLDETREFSPEQRLAIYRRDKGVCQLKNRCEDKKMGWDDNWHIDHKIPYSKGGHTSVANGQLACAECNLAKGNNG